MAEYSTVKKSIILRSVQEISIVLVAVFALLGGLSGAMTKSILAFIFGLVLAEVFLVIFVVTSFFRRSHIICIVGLFLVIIVLLLIAALI